MLHCVLIGYDAVIRSNAGSSCIQERAVFKNKKKTKKKNYNNKNDIFLISTYKYVMGIHLKHLTWPLLMSIHIDIRKIFTRYHL